MDTFLGRLLPVPLKSALFVPGLTGPLNNLWVFFLLADTFLGRLLPVPLKSALFVPGLTGPLNNLLVLDLFQE